MCGNFNPQIKINMKNLNLSESQAAVDEIKSVVTQINALLKDGGSVSATASAPAKRGPKPGAKRGPKAGAKRGPKPGAKRGPQAKTAVVVDATATEAPLAPSHPTSQLLFHPKSNTR